MLVYQRVEFLGDFFREIQWGFLKTWGYHGYLQNVEVVQMAQVVEKWDLFKKIMGQHGTSWGHHGTNGYV